MPNAFKGVGGLPRAYLAVKLELRCTCTYLHTQAQASMTISLDSMFGGHVCLRMRSHRRKQALHISEWHNCRAPLLNSGVTGTNKRPEHMQPDKGRKRAGDPPD